MWIAPPPIPDPEDNPCSEIGGFSTLFKTLVLSPIVIGFVLLIGYLIVNIMEAQ